MTAKLVFFAGFLLASTAFAGTNSIDWSFGRPGINVVTNAPSKNDLITATNDVLEYVSGSYLSNTGGALRAESNQVGLSIGTRAYATGLVASVAMGDLTWAKGQYSTALGGCVVANDFSSFVWSGVYNAPILYSSHGSGTFSINPKYDEEGFYIGDLNFVQVLSNYTHLVTLDKLLSHDNICTTNGFIIGSLARNITYPGFTASSAIGLYNYPFGLYSFIVGNTCATSNEYTFAQGINCIAAGSSSFANGAEAKAYGDYSHAEGLQTKTTAKWTHADGYGAIASNQYAYAWSGTGTYGSHGTGTYSINPVNGTAGFYIGSRSLGDYLSAIIENNNNNYDRATNITAKTYLPLSGGTLIGGLVVTNAPISIFGSSLILNNSSAVINTGNLNINDGSLAVGKTCSYGTDNSFALGRECSALGRNSIAAGEDCLVSENAWCSFAFGSGSYATNMASFVWNWGIENEDDYYGSHGPSTFNVRPKNGALGVYIGETNLAQTIRNYSPPVDLTTRTTHQEVTNIVRALLANIAATYSNRTVTATQLLNALEGN